MRLREDSRTVPGTQIINHNKNKNFSRVQNEPVRRGWTIESDFEHALSKMLEKRPFQLRMQSISAGQAVYLSAFTDAAAGEPQIGNKDYKR